MRRSLLRLLALACLATLALSEESGQATNDGQGAVDAAPVQTSTQAADANEPASTSAAAAAAASPTANYIPRQPNSRPTSRRSGRRGNKGKNRCRVPGCSRCAANDRTVCEACRVGYGLTTDGQCQTCGGGCQSCASAGPGKCDKCKKGFTLDKITREAAAHAGGGCHGARDDGRIDYKSFAKALAAAGRGGGHRGAAGGAGGGPDRDRDRRAEELSMLRNLRADMADCQQTLESVPVYRSIGHKMATHCRSHSLQRCMTAEPVQQQQQCYAGSAKKAIALQFQQQMAKKH